MVAGWGRWACGPSQLMIRELEEPRNSPHRHPEWSLGNAITLK